MSVTRWLLLLLYIFHVLLLLRSENKLQQRGIKKKKTMRNNRISVWCKNKASLHVDTVSDACLCRVKHRRKQIYQIFIGSFIM